MTQLEFLSALTETDESKIAGIEIPHIQVRSFFPVIMTKKCYLSVQASKYHHSLPRETVPLEEYYSMEFAIVSHNGGMLQVKDVLPDFPNLEEIEGYHDVVYSYVPVELIEQVYQALKAKPTGIFSLSKMLRGEK